MPARGELSNFSFKAKPRKASLGQAPGSYLETGGVRSALERRKGLGRPQGRCGAGRGTGKPRSASNRTLEADVGRQVSQAGGGARVSEETGWRRALGAAHLRAPFTHPAFGLLAAPFTNLRPTSCLPLSGPGSTSFATPGSPRPWQEVPSRLPRPALLLPRRPLEASLTSRTPGFPGRPLPQPGGLGVSAPFTLLRERAAMLPCSLRAGAEGAGIAPPKG